MRSAEIAKYEAAYRQPDYGMGDERRQWMHRTLADLDRGSLLDVGAGRGETVAHALALGFAPVAGTEVVPYLTVPPIVYAEAWSLPFADREFDVVTCLDVLEHLLLADHAAALRELYRVTGRSLIVTAANYASQHHGVELHVGRRDTDNWDRLIRECCPGDVQPLGWCGTADGWRITRLDRGN